MSNMRQEGSINATLVSLIVAVVLLLGTAIFGAWAYAGRQDYKENSDQKSRAAVAVAVKQTEADDAVKYAEEAKNPLKTYVGPEAFGAVTVVYPKTWSTYVIERDNSGGTPLNNYFHPDVVPNVDNPDSTYSLRVKIEQRPYSSVVEGYKGQVKQGKLTSQAYKLPKVEGVEGIRLDGQITAKKQGSLIILPLRNLTLEISTESNQYLPDFNNIILPNLSFSP